ncbi:hypothetical protein GO599_11510 [Sulfolobus islandicus]|uniref:Uncharacterized protein n=2 Tax=Saccharolobus islandicus TaxID=43080 RepID=F0NKV4_SACI0|nr:conserved hypothetical protein [Sulfolobus islandicus HVE10/4]WCM38017.1 hypothetical protein GO599_11510 [Sulfolobus islandicus]
MVRSMNLKNLFLILIIILIISASLYIIFNHKQSQHNLGSITSNSTIGQNSTELDYAKKILIDAKETYLNATEENKTGIYLIYEPYSNFSKEFILNATFINGSTVVIGHTLYKYIILHVYYENFDYIPQKIQVNGIKVELLPNPSNVTYTGGEVYHYLITYDNKTYNVTLYSIGFVETSYYLTASTQKIGNLYIVQITTTKELDNTAYADELWLILIRP